MERRLDEAVLAAFRANLTDREMGGATIEKYMGDIESFMLFLEGREVTRTLVLQYKSLRLKKKASSTVNASLSALNQLFAFLGWTDCRVKFLKVQRSPFRDRGRELKREDYDALVRTAEQLQKKRLALVMEAICSTGIRVSELKYITVDSAARGRAQVELKGKIRVVLLSQSLCTKLLKYAEEKKIASGEIFITRSGRSLSRTQVWAEMKSLCEKAGVDASKVFPHNLRHLFAATYYRLTKDIVKLADILGHSSIDTTRIYLVTTGEEHRQQLELLRLVS